jgi:hypothetical protein
MAIAAMLFRFCRDIQSQAAAVVALASRLLEWSFGALVIMSTMVVIVADAWIVRLTIPKQTPTNHKKIIMILRLGFNPEMKISAE